MEKKLENFVVQFSVRVGGNLEYDNSNVELKRYEKQQLSCKPEQINLRGASYMKSREVCTVKKFLYFFKKPTLNLTYTWTNDLVE